MQYGALLLCSLLATTSQFSVLIGHKMHLTGWYNGNEMRNALCVDTQTSIEWPYCPSLYCGSTLTLTLYSSSCTHARIPRQQLNAGTWRQNLNYLKFKMVESQISYCTSIRRQAPKYSKKMLGCSQEWRRTYRRSFLYIVCTPLSSVFLWPIYRYNVKFVAVPVASPAR